MRDFFLTQRCKDAKTQSFFYKFFSVNLRICGFALIFVSPIFAQKLAVLVPEKTVQSRSFAEKLETSLSAKFKIPDNSLSEAAFRSVEVENIFNLTKVEAKNIGAILGCDYFLLIKSANQRRVALSKNDYYESFAVIYVISSRTGRLVDWNLQTFEAEKESEAEKLLLASTDQAANKIGEKLKLINKQEPNETNALKIEEVPDENSADAKNFCPPLPFKRFKPEYTRLAYLYSVAATVEIELDLDENGKILRTEIVRWAGFGLDESVTETVRKMNWRAAERNGKTLPMRILLRYNFRKVGTV
jgi:Gram-negative bacterial TonB protein C-terminal